MSLNAVANSDEQKIPKTETIKKNVVEIFGEGDEYRVISSIGNVKITLDTPLRKNDYYTSKSRKPTDTDRDGIWDWDEVCIDALEELKQEKIADGVIYAKDMPSLLEVMTYYNKNKKGYVVEGFEKYMHDNNGNPFSALKSTYILPINSNPCDADSDNDGIPDDIDVLKLNAVNDYNPIKDINDVFIIVKDLSGYNIKSNILDNCKLYTLPHNNAKTTANVKGNVDVVAIVYSDSCYWIKIFSDGLFDYIKAENVNFNISPYIYVHDVVTDAIYYGNKSNINVTKTNRECCEFYKKNYLYLDTYLHFKANRQNITDTDTGNPNVCGATKYDFSYEAQEYMQSVCDTVINIYENDKKNNISIETVNYLNKYLTPELIMAIGSTESGWKTTTGNKTGIKSTGSIPNCLGSENADTNVESYKNFKDSVAASAFIIAHIIHEQIDGGWTNVYGNNFYADNSLNDGQILFNALYSYGIRTTDGYSYMEAAVSSAHKLYRYGSLCKQRKGFVMIDTSTKAINEYANNEWQFTFENIPINKLTVQQVGIND